MSGPAKEGARQCASFKAVGTAPSINLTPVGDKSIPLPYTTFQDLSNSVAVVPNVLLNGKPAYVLEQSIQPSCQGDEPGTDKGVKSETVGGYVKPTESSSTVTMMGMLAVRVGDACVMNGGNNPGIYTCEEPVAPNPAKSAAETSNPDIELETPEEQSSVSQWLEETSNDLSEWWEQTKYEMGEAVDHPWEGTKGAVKSLVNIVPETGEMILKGYIKKEASNLEIAAAILNLLGGSESAQGASATAQMLNNAGDSIEAPKLEMSNDAQAGGDNIVTGATGITGIIGMVKSLPKLMAKFGSKAAKEADEVVEEATSPGDGVVVKPAGSAPDKPVAKPGESDFIGPAPQETSTVFRVQGGDPPLASRQHVVLDADGNPRINRTTLNISIGDPEHAQYFLSQRRPGAEITSFEIPKWMDDFIQGEAIPQANYRANPFNQSGLAPKIVDPTTPGRSYELPPVWAEWLEETAIQGSGRVSR